MKQIIKNQLNLIYEGDPWYGHSVRSVLESVNPKHIFKSPGNNMHSIAEIAAHILSYRKFAVHRLQGSLEPPPVQELTFEWENISKNKKNVWEAVMEQFNITQQNLLLLLDEIEDSFLDKKVHGKDYSYRYMLNGVVQHDLYHLGQIVYIHKLISKKRELADRVFPFEH